MSSQWDLGPEKGVASLEHLPVRVFRVYTPLRSLRYVLDRFHAGKRNDCDSIE